MKMLENKRDKLAFDYSLTRLNHMTAESSFIEGFNAAVKELEPMIKELVDAITDAAEYHNVDDVNGEAGYIAWKALQKYKQQMGDE